MDKNIKNIIKFSICVIVVIFLLYLTTLRNWHLWHIISFVVGLILFFGYLYHVFTDK